MKIQHYFASSFSVWQCSRLLLFCCCCQFSSRKTWVGLITFCLFNLWYGRDPIPRTTSRSFKTYSNRHLYVQSQQWKHQNNLWNMLKIINKDARTISWTSFWCLCCEAWTDFTHCSNIGWYKTLTIYNYPC